MNRTSPFNGRFFVWAGGVDKAVIELSRGNAYTEYQTALAHKRTGLKLWVIRVEEVDKKGHPDYEALSKM